MRTRFRQIVMVAAGLTLPFAASAKALKPQILVSFTGAKGIEPQGTLVADAAGNLYGTNQAGGAAGKGTVFELSPPAGGKKAWTTKLLFTFTGSNGSLPVAGLVFDKAGNLYGTALTGGASGDGAVFELVAPATGKAKWTEKLRRQQRPEPAGGRDLRYIRQFVWCSDRRRRLQRRHRVQADPAHGGPDGMDAHHPVFLQRHLHRGRANRHADHGQSGQHLWHHCGRRPGQ
jgi:uncharacterized repeat protein (TIGR03803 family)